MKKILSIFLLMVFLFDIVLPCYAKTVNVKAGTPIDFVITKSKSSSTAVEGERINISIDKNVIVKGVKVFETGGKGYLYVSEIKERGFWGEGGAISVNRGFFYDVNGNEHRIDFTERYVGKDKTWAAAIAAIGIYTIILCPLGLFAFVKGKDAQTKINVPLEAYILEEFDFEY